jgi:hypothetical protein
MVEAPGTAPGSERFITMTVYRHSSCEQDIYKRACRRMQTCRGKLAQLAAASFGDQPGIEPRPRFGRIKWRAESQLDGAGDFLGTSDDIDRAIESDGILGHSVPIEPTGQENHGQAARVVNGGQAA